MYPVEPGDFHKNNVLLQHNDLDDDVIDHAMSGQFLSVLCE